MSWTCHFDTERDVFIATATGVITEQYLRENVRLAYQDPRFHPDLRCFLDYSGVTDWQIPISVLTDLAASRKFSGKSRTAFFVVGSLSYGMTRAYQIFVDKGVVQIFTDRASAVAWLNEGVPPEKWLAAH